MKKPASGVTRFVGGEFLAVWCGQGNGDYASDWRHGHGHGVSCLEVGADKRKSYKGSKNVPEGLAELHALPEMEPFHERERRRPW